MNHVSTQVSNSIFTCCTVLNVSLRLFEELSIPPKDFSLRSSNMSDALLALRDAIKSQSLITYATPTGTTEPTLLAAASLVLPLSPPVTLAKSTPTRFRKSGAPPTSTDPTATPNDFFTVEAVYLAWLLREAPGAEYMKQARENGLAVGFVSVTERKGLVDWLEGRASEHQQIIGAFFSPIIRRLVITLLICALRHS